MNTQISVHNRKTLLGKLVVIGYQVWKHKLLLLMLLPTVIYFIIFRYGPIFGLIIAFKDFQPQAGAGFIQSIIDSRWVGLKHFYSFFNSLNGVQVLINTILISVYKIIFGFPAPIVLALILNEIRNQKFKRVSQTVSYLPHFISWVILAGIVRIIFSPDQGLLVPIFKMIGIDAINPIGDPKYFRSLLVITDIWAGVGWGSIIYLAAISGIDEQLYEAAIIDGADRFKQLVHITIPSISSTIVIMFILKTGSILDAGFDQVFNLYNPAVYSVGDIIDTYVYRVGIQRFQFSFSTAISFFKSFIGLVMVLITNFIAKRLGEEGIW